MIKLTTAVEIQPLDLSIQNHSQGLFIGSCFAQELGARLAMGEMPVEVNPQGVLYNPLSVARGVELFKNGANFTPNDLTQRDQLWHSWAHHSTFSAPTPQEALAKINRPASPTKLDYIVITLGSAFVYFRGEQVVANCHKFPEAEFTRRKISVQETIDALKQVRTLYTDAYIVLTVSPIRHLRDGLMANSLSKATLRVACSEFCGSDPHSGYFPSYEIMMDELRDYRFYAPDMLHPSPLAVDIIFESFAQACISPQSRLLIKDGLSRSRAQGHRQLSR
ncbi:MAG: GSCFA domain-containing protein [Mucinivorans sp.]